MDTIEIANIKKSLTGVQGKVFSFLEDKILHGSGADTGPITFSEISDAILCNKSSVQKGIQRLESKGFIRKVNSRPGKGGWCNYSIPSLLIEMKGIGKTKISSEIQDCINLFNELASEAIILHRSGIIIYANPAYIRMFGYPLSEIIGKSSPDLVVAPDSRKKVREVIRKGHSARYIINGVRKDGRIFPMEIESKLALFKDDEVRVTLHRDITSLMDAKEEIEKDHNRLLSVIEAIPAFVCVIGEDDIIRKANGKFKEIFGDCEGMPCWKAVRGLDSKCEACIRFTSEMSEDCEQLFKHPNGRTHQLYVSHLSDDDDQDVKLVMGVDITEKEKISWTLEKNVKALQEKNLMLKGVLSQIDDEKNSLRQNISLNIERNIIPLIQKLKGTDVSAKDRAKFSTIVETIENCLNDINDDFYTKLEKLKRNLTSSEFRICHLIRSGRTLMEVGDILNISENTVKGHCRNIRKKLGLTSSGVTLKVHLMKIVNK